METNNEDDRMQKSTSVGSLNQPNGLKIAKHISADDKGDYYDMFDDLTKFPGHG